MKISEAIKILQDAQTKFGDVDVGVYDDHSPEAVTFYQWSVSDELFDSEDGPENFNHILLFVGN